MVKVYDCFPFFNELDILEIRLNELDKVVDYFVICEAALTFTGEPKEKLFRKNVERFEKFSHKIIYLCVDSFPENLDRWSRDIYQREHLKAGVKDAEPDDLIIISDVDEILRREAIAKALAFRGVTQFSMNMYQYYMNMLYRPDWCAAFAVPKNLLDRLDVDDKRESLSVSRYKMQEITNKVELDYQVVEDAGWHFSYMGGMDALKTKFKAYAHANDYWPRLMSNEDRLQHQIDAGIKIWTADEPARYVPIDESYPEYVRDNFPMLDAKGYFRDIYQAYAKLQDMFLDLKKHYSFSLLGDETKRALLGDLNSYEYLEFAHIREPDLSYLNLPVPVGKLVSSGKYATQSSMSKWSIGLTPADDAKRALIGTPSGNFSFHTEMQDDPWWMVDLGNVEILSEVRIFNRLLPYSAHRDYTTRANDLAVLVSDDAKRFRVVYFHDDAGFIGGIDGHPLIVNFKKKVTARYVRIQVGGYQVLHLDKVYIYAKSMANG